MIIFALYIYNQDRSSTMNKTESKIRGSGTGDIKIYDTDPRTAAMLMAIVASSMNVPLSNLRFISIRELKGNEK